MVMVEGPVATKVRVLGVRPRLFRSLIISHLVVACILAPFRTCTGKFAGRCSVAISSAIAATSTTSASAVGLTWNATHAEKAKKIDFWKPKFVETNTVFVSPDPRLMASLNQPSVSSGSYPENWRHKC